MVIFHLRVEPLELLSFFVPQMLFSGFVISKDTFNLIVNIIFCSVDAWDSPPVSYEQSHPGPPTAQPQVFPEVQKSSSRQDFSSQILCWLFSPSGFRGTREKIEEMIISLWRTNNFYFWKYLIQERVAKRATFSAIAWAPDSFNVWQRVISLCRSLSLLFARDFELRFTYSLYACVLRKGTVGLDFMGS